MGHPADCSRSMQNMDDTYRTHESSLNYKKKIETNNKLIRKNKTIQASRMGRHMQTIDDHNGTLESSLN
jgi:hypothetical protein